VLFAWLIGLCINLRGIGLSVLHQCLFGSSRSVVPEHSRRVGTRVHDKWVTLQLHFQRSLCFGQVILKSSTCMLPFFLPFPFL
jgi:hypothetical protein